MTTNAPSAGQGPSSRSRAAALCFALISMAIGYHQIGLAPVLIVGGASAIGYLLWTRSYRHGPIAPEVILPPFLLTVAALELHMIEEYVTRFGPAMSRTFDISWSEPSFLIVFAFIGPILYTLTALGLYRRVPLAGFLAWFIFIGPGMAEFTHFIFPLIEPAIQPANPEPVTAVVRGGKAMHDMPNYWIGATDRYYFPGLYTAILPMIPGIYGIVAVIRAAKRKEST